MRLPPTSLAPFPLRPSPCLNNDDVCVTKCQVNIIMEKLWQQRPYRTQNTPKQTTKPSKYFIKFEEGLSEIWIKNLNFQFKSKLFFCLRIILILLGFKRLTFGVVEFVPGWMELLHVWNHIYDKTLERKYGTDCTRTNPTFGPPSNFSTLLPKFYDEK